MLFDWLKPARQLAVVCMCITLSATVSCEDEHTVQAAANAVEATRESANGGDQNPASSIDTTDTAGEPAPQTPAAKTPTQAAIDRLYEASKTDPWAAACFIDACFRRWERSTVTTSFEGQVLPESAKSYYNDALTIIQDKNYELDTTTKVRASLAVERFVDKKDEGTDPRGLARMHTWFGTLAQSNYDIAINDKALAAHHFELAAKGGDAHGMALHAMSLMRQAGNDAAKRDQALKLVTRSQEAGSALGAAMLGYFHEAGLGVPQDYAKAMKYHSIAAEMNNSFSAVAIARFHLYGLGVPKDIPKALELLRKLAMSGNSEAAHLLGWLSQDGRQIKQDSAVARQWYARAVNHRHLDSHLRLGQMHLKGEGGERDYKQGFRLLTQWASLSLSEQEIANWTRDYRSAEFINEAEFMRRVPAVQVKVKVTPKLTGYLSEERANAIAKAVAIQQGLKVNTHAPITLTIDTIGWLTDQSLINTIAMEMRFVLTTPVLRDGHFWNLRVAPVHRVSCQSNKKNLSRNSVENWFGDQLRQNLKAIKERNNKPRPERQANWQKSLWPQKDDQTFAQRYKQATGYGEIFANASYTGMKTYRSYYYNMDNAPRATSFISRTDVDKLWNKALSESRLKKDDDSPFEVEHWMLGVRYTSPPFLLSIYQYTMLQNFAWRQRDVVFKLDDKFVRMDPVFHGGMLMQSFANDKDAGPPFVVMVNSTIENALREINKQQ